MINYIVGMSSIKGFNAWAGGERVQFELDGRALELADQWLEEWSEYDDLTETNINDWLWFECADWLAEEHGLNLDGTPVDGDEDEE